MPSGGRGGRGGRAGEILASPEAVSARDVDTIHADSQAAQTIYVEAPLTRRAPPLTHRAALQANPSPEAIATREDYRRRWRPR